MVAGDPAVAANLAYQPDGLKPNLVNGRPGMALPDEYPGDNI